MRKLKRLILPTVILIPLNAYATSPIKISGLMEVDASFSKDYNQNKTSDVTVAKVELAFDATINAQTTAHILMLHEDNNTEPMQLSEGIITIQLGNGWYFNGGRMVVPFGTYETNFVTNPITTDLGEAHKAALQFGFERNGLYGSLYAYNGNTIKTSTALKGDDNAEHFGTNIGYILNSGETSFNIGADFTSSLAEADAVSGALSINTDTDGDAIADTATLSSYTHGISLHGIYTHGPWIAIMEYLKADRFQATELAFNGRGAAPSATNLEAAYSFSWGSIAMAYQTTSDALTLGLPKYRTVIGLSMRLIENSTLNIEHWKDQDYSNNVGGSGASRSKSTIQLAVTF